MYGVILNDIRASTHLSQNLQILNYILART